MRANPNFRQQLDKAFNQATKVLAYEVAGQHIDNLGTQVGTGIQYPELPNQSSLSSGNRDVTVGEIPPDAPEFPVVQSGGLIDSVNAERDGDDWYVGYINANLTQVIRLEFGDFQTSARKGLYETASSEETMQRVENELRKL